MSIVRETHQTMFMIRHDVDEANLLSDRIFLMTNGHQAPPSGRGRRSVGRR